jgi:hypothetical protein
VAVGHRQIARDLEPGLAGAQRPAQIADQSSVRRQAA